MRKWFFAIVVTIFLPVVTLAAQVGFIPSTGVWFSQNDVKLGETVRIYTVVVNNEHYLLNSTVAFYDNGTLVDSVVVTALKKDEARQLRVFWEPSVGNHQITAKFIKAEAIDEKGAKIPLVLDAVGGATLLVRQNNDRLTLSSPDVLGDKIVAITSQQATTTTTIVATTSPDIFEQGNALAQKAQGALQVVTSTADKVGQAYAQVKAWIATGGTWYEQGKAKFEQAGPVFDDYYSRWQKITGGNELVRWAFSAVVGVLVLWLLYRLYRRKRFYDDL